MENADTSPRALCKANQAGEFGSGLNWLGWSHLQAGPAKGLPHPPSLHPESPTFCHSPALSTPLLGQPASASLNLLPKVRKWHFWRAENLWRCSPAPFSSSEHMSFLFLQSAEWLKLAQSAQLNMELGRRMGNYSSNCAMLQRYTMFLQLFRISFDVLKCLWKMWDTQLKVNQMFTSTSEISSKINYFKMSWRTLFSALKKWLKMEKNIMCFQ